MSQRAFDYLGYGLRIASDLAIPGAMPAPVIKSGAVDIDISEGSADLGGEASVSGPYRWRGDAFVFGMPGVARYLCLGGSRIVVERAAGASDADVSAMLIATALPALLWSRGDVVLHASAFSFPGATSAIAVAGPSGSGKSTLLAHAVAAGARAIADDSIRIRLDRDASVVAYGLAGGYFVGEGEKCDRTFAPVPVASQLAGQKLGAVLVLSPEARAPRRLDTFETLAALLANRHRPRIAHLMRTEPATLPIIAAIARSIPVLEVSARAALL